MKSIKNLGITTLEGFEVRNLERGYSLEWGPEGSLIAELYYKGKHIMRVYQEGNGGCAITYQEDYYREHKTEIDLQCLRFLKRVDKSYGPDSPYDWLRDKKINKIDDDDWEAVVNNIEEYYDDVKAAATAFRAGYKAVVSMKNDYQTSYLQYRVSNITIEEVQAYMKKNGLDKKFNEIKILLPVPELSIL